MLDLTKTYRTANGEFTGLKLEIAGRDTIKCPERWNAGDSPFYWRADGSRSVPFCSDDNQEWALIAEEPEATLDVELLSGLPDGNPKTAQGVKKPGISAVPPSAILHLGQAMRDGAQKYGRSNWRSDAVTASTYYDAAFRHLAAWHDGEEVDGLSGVTHLGHAMACCAILLDAQACGKLLDDRVPGPFRGVADGMTKS